MNFNLYFGFINAISQWDIIFKVGKKSVYMPKPFLQKNLYYAT